MKLAIEQNLEALKFLEDGASYDEVARTLGVPRTTVQDRYPGYGWSLSDSARFTAQTRKLWKKVDKLWALHFRTEEPFVS